MVLTFAITGPLMLASRSLHASVDARNRLIATHLAEQSIEMIRSVRDNNSSDDLTPDRSAWMQDILPACATKCVTDQSKVANGKFTPASIIACPAGNCGTSDRVYLNPNTGMYAQNSTQVQLTATVTYVGVGGVTRSVVLVDDLYNWFPALHS